MLKQLFPETQLFITASCLFLRWNMHLLAHRRELTEEGGMGI
jgi:hypothetical protein